MTGGSVPDLFLVALATLNLLTEVATRKPLLLLVDDAHWLDRATCDALAFVARRLESDPVVLLAAIRDGFDVPLEHAALAELQIQGLDDGASSDLLHAIAPTSAADPTTCAHRGGWQFPWHW
jgi:hypothetical protein